MSKFTWTKRQQEGIPGKVSRLRETGKILNYPKVRLCIAGSPLLDPPPNHVTPPHSKEDDIHLVLRGEVEIALVSLKRVSLLELIIYQHESIKLAGRPYPGVMTF